MERLHQRVLLLSGAPRDDVDVADLNSDGHLDIVSPVYPNMDILLGNGDGTFVAAPSLSDEPSSVAIDDMDGDGRLDLVANSTSYKSLTKVYRGNGDGTFQAAVQYVTGPDTSSVAVADFNGDGLRDIAVVSGGAIRVLLHEANGIFPAAIANRWASSGLDAGDFNGDGLLDLASGTTNSDSVRIHLAVGTHGIYPAYQSYAVGDSPRDVVIQDFNNDGDLDLITANGSGTVSLLLGNGDGTFVAAMSFPGGTQPRDLKAADFNADGNADLLIASTGSVQLVLGNGDGTFQAPVPLLTETGPPAGITTADFNNDGKLDFAVVAPGAVAVRLGNGDGGFQAPLVYAVLALGLDLTAGDFNSDGFVDIAAINNDNIAILFNAADWPPLPIGDGPRPSAPPDGGETTEMLHAAVAPTQTSRPATINPMDQIATASRPKYATRYIGRVSLAAQTDPTLDVLVTVLN